MPQRAAVSLNAFHSTVQAHKKLPKEHRNACFSVLVLGVRCVDQDSTQVSEPRAGTCTMLWRTAHPRRPGEWQGEGRQGSIGGKSLQTNGSEDHSKVPSSLLGTAEVSSVRGPWGLTAGILSSPRAVAGPASPDSLY